MVSPPPKNIRALIGRRRVPAVETLPARLNAVEVAIVVAVLLSGIPSVSAVEFRTSFEVESGAYGVDVRVPLDRYSYPRLVIDTGAASPRRGTMYVLALTQLTCADILVSSSTDGGTTFSQPAVASGQCLSGPGLDAVVGADGTLYVATRGPKVHGSNDGGVSWELLASFTDDVEGKVLAMSPGGTLYLLWSNGTWGSLEPGPVKVTVSQDDGRNWSPPLDVLPSGISGVAAQIAATDEKVVVVYVGIDVGGGYVAVVNSTDAGSTWGAESRLSTIFQCARVSAPSIAASPSGTFAVSWSFEPATGPGGCPRDWGNETEVRVATLWNSQAPTIERIPGPGWASYTLGDAIAFDDHSRPYVTWHSIAAEWSSASVHVAAGGTVGSLVKTLAVPGGNSSQQENLAVGLGGSVWLIRTAYSSLTVGGAEGVYVRRVVGGAVVQVEGLEVETLTGITLRDEDGTPHLGNWTGTPVAFSDLPPGNYDVWVGANASTSLITIPVNAFGITTLNLAPGTESSHPPSFVVPVLVGVAAATCVTGLVLIRRRRRP